VGEEGERERRDSVMNTLVILSKGQRGEGEYLAAGPVCIIPEN
jgi:hypothetical protein